MLSMIETNGFSGFIDGTLPIPPKILVQATADGLQVVIHNVEYLAWKYQIGCLRVG